MYPINGDRPKNGDKFYNTVENGGYSKCIQGKPTIKDLDVLCNCVGAACGFFNKVYSDVTGYATMRYPYLNCNAEDFIKRAKKYYPDIKVVDEPTEGGIMVWEGIDTKTKKRAGHVEGVVKCLSSTQVYNIASGYNHYAWANQTRNKGENGNWGLNTKYFKYLGCLVNPALGEQRSYEIDITPNVDRDENQDQIEVKIDNLHVRTGAGLDKDILGFASKGFYNYYESEEADGYVWYRIADDQWIAYKENWETLYPKSEPEPTPTEIKVGDSVIVNGVGTAASTGEGAKTKRYVNKKMKVIMISGNVSRPNRYALNQYNKGNINDPRAVTGWFSINDIKK